MKKMMAACMIVALSGVTANAADYISISTKFALKMDAPACNKEEALDKLKSLLSEGDKEAFNKQWLSYVLSGDCLNVEKGTQVTVEDTSIWHGDMCIRPKGEPDCVWTINNPKFKDGN